VPALRAVATGSGTPASDPAAVWHRGRQAPSSDVCAAGRRAPAAAP